MCYLIENDLINLVCGIQTNLGKEMAKFADALQVIFKLSQSIDQQHIKI